VSGTRKDLGGLWCRSARALAAVVLARSNGLRRAQSDHSASVFYAGFVLFNDAMPGRKRHRSG